jgi:aldose 1-epimerase
MFVIKEKPFGPLTEYYLINQATLEHVSVLPGFGATLNRVALKKGDQLHELVDGCASYEVLMTEGKSKFKGSKLFPFPNRIADGTYTFENKVYQFPVNFPHEKNAIHGIILESNFVVINKDVAVSGCSLIVEYKTTGNEEGYPFKTVVTIQYNLTKEGFSCITTIKNSDKVNVPLADGWHPYFKTGSKMDQCVLTLPVEKSYEVDQRMIPTGKTNQETTFTKPTVIGETKFDTGYKLVKSDEKNLVTVIFDPQKKITLKIWQESGEGKYNYLQVYIPPDRMSIAIEPMTGIANAYNNKEGLMVLKPEETRIFSFGLKVE